MNGIKAVGITLLQGGFQPLFKLGRECMLKDLVRYSTNLEFMV